MLFIYTKPKNTGENMKNLLIIHEFHANEKNISENHTSFDVKFKNNSTSGGYKIEAKYTRKLFRN
jgi:hypothetical protein